MVKRTLFAFLALTALAIPDAVYACSCALRSPCDTFWTADLVFIGRTQSVVEKRRGDQVTRFVVEEWLQQTKPEELGAKCL